MCDCEIRVGRSRRSMLLLVTAKLSQALGRHQDNHQIAFQDLLAYYPSDQDPSHSIRANLFFLTEPCRIWPSARGCDKLEGRHRGHPSKSHDPETPIYYRAIASRAEERRGYIWILGVTAWPVTADKAIFIYIAATIETASVLS